MTAPDGTELPSPLQLAHLADVLAGSLQAGFAEVERRLEGTGFHMLSYRTGAESVISTIRGMALLQMSGLDPLSPEVTEEQMRAVLEPLASDAAPEVRHDPDQ